MYTTWSRLNLLDMTGGGPPLSPPRMASWCITILAVSPLMAQAFRSARYLANISAGQLRAELSADKFPRPVHVGRDLIADWPALRTWSLEDGLRRLRDGIGEHCEVDVELGPRGRGYLHKDHARVSMGFGKPEQLYARGILSRY